MGVAYLQKWLIGDMIISCVLYTRRDIIDNDFNEASIRLRIKLRY